MSLDRYNRITKINKKTFQATPTAFIPKPKEQDYIAGYIVRYFVQAVNDNSAPITEVKSNGYSKFTSNPFYKTVALDWRLTGSPSDVKKSNKTSVFIASKTIPKLKLYLPNLIQFYDASYYTEPREIPKEVEETIVGTVATGSAFENNTAVAGSGDGGDTDGIQTTTISPTYTSTFGTFDGLDEGDFTEGSTFEISGSETRPFGNTGVTSNMPYVSFARSTTANFVEPGDLVVEQSTWDLDFKITASSATENGSVIFYFPSVNGTGYSVSEPLDYSQTGSQVFSDNLTGSYTETINFGNQTNNLRWEFTNKPSTFDLPNSDISWEFNYSARIQFIGASIAFVDTNEFTSQSITPIEDWVREPATPSNLSADTSNAPFTTLNWSYSSFPDPAGYTFEGFNVYIDGDKYNDSLLPATFGSNTYDITIPDGTYELRVAAVWNDGTSSLELTDNTITFTVTGNLTRVVEYPLEDFEGYNIGDVPDGFQNDLIGGDEPNKYGFFIDDTRALSGTKSLASDVNQVGQDNSHSRILFPISISVDTEISLDYYLSSEGSSFDYFRIFINGVEEIPIQNTVGAWTSYTKTLSAGDYTIAFEYVKDSLIGSGDDRLWIDNFSFLPI